jgi:predicted amidohydrolase YtcJ
MTQPYLVDGPDGQKNWSGKPFMSEEKFSELFSSFYKQGLQLWTHVNGDAAIDMLINIHRELDTKLSDNRRSVAIHSQFVRPDQLDSYTKSGISPSYLNNHAFFWGDTHYKNLGKKRAFFLSPMQATLDRSIRFTIHSDNPVTPPDPMLMIWTATTRQSRSGTIMGKEQRISSYDAIKALTLNGAWQYFEEDTKGSIEVGKLADLVILSDNPLTVSTDKVRTIKIEQTIKEGRVIYSRQE